MKTGHIFSLISNVRDKGNKLISKELEAHDIRGLASSHGDILFVLFNFKILPMMEIAKRINRDKSTVTALIKKLEAMGYVEKTADPDDSRVTLISLTDNGWKLKPVFDRISEKLLKQVYKGFTGKEKEEIITGLERLFKNM